MPRLTKAQRAEAEAAAIAAAAAEAQAAADAAFDAAHDAAHIENAQRNLAAREAAALANTPAADAARDAENLSRRERSVAGIVPTYTGPSPLIRTRTKAARVIINAVAGNFTDRTRASFLDIRAARGGNAFPAGAIDAGILRQLIAHGFIAHVAGTGHAYSDNGHDYIADGDFYVTKLGLDY